MLASDPLRPRLEELARRAAEPVGVDVAWIEFKPEGPTWFFRVFIDGESGVGLEECEQVSERLGVLLDVEDPIQGDYNLEVSSPGADRKLVKPEHFDRFAGHGIKMKLRRLVSGRRRLKGQLLGREGDVVEVNVFPGDRLLETGAEVK